MRHVLALALLLPLTGCGLLFGGGPRTEVTRLDPEAAALGEGLPVTTGDLERPYDEVAVLTVGPRGWSSTDDLVDDLRRAARRLDADAVVRVDFEQYADEDGFVRRVAFGTVVRFR